MESFDSFINEKYEDLTEYKILCRDPDESLKNLIEYIQSIGNMGHSFSIIVDPGDRDHEKKFGWDGDGADHIKEIKVVKNGKAD